MAAGDLKGGQCFPFGNITYECSTVATAGGTVASSSTQAHTGTYSLRVNRTSANAANANWSTNSGCVEGVSGAMSGCFWLYPASLPTGTTSFFLSSNAGENLYLVMDTSGRVYVNNVTNSTAGAASSGVVTTGAWNRIEWQQNNTGGSFKVRVNGANEATKTVTALTQTLNSWTAGCSGVHSSNFDFYYDNLTLWEGAVWPGNVRYEVIRPNGDVSGTYTIVGGDPTRTDAINDSPASTTTYIETSTNAAAQVFEWSTYTLAAGEKCKSTQAWGVLGSNTTSANWFTVYFNNAGGTNGTSATFSVNVNGWVRNQAVLIQRTAIGGGGFSQAYLDGMRFRMVKSTHALPARCAEIAGAIVVLETARTPQSLSGGLSFTSGQSRKIRFSPLAGSLSFTSAQTRKVGAAKAATLSFTSAQTKKVARAATATLEFTSAQTKKVARAVTAGLSFTGSHAGALLVSAVQQALTAGLSFAGSLTHSLVISKALTAALDFTGAQTRKVSTALGGALSFTGANTRLRRLATSFTAGLSFTSNQSKRMAVVIAARISFGVARLFSPRRYGSSAGPGTDRTTTGTPVGSTRGVTATPSSGSGRSSTGSTSGGTRATDGTPNSAPGRGA